MEISDSKKYSLVFFSGNRAEYYIQEPLIIALARESIFNVYLILHHSYTSANTEKLDNEAVNIIELSSKLDKEEERYNSNYMHSFVISNVIGQVAEYLVSQDVEFDLAVAYADRFETFAFAIATSQAGIPLLHMEAGDITEGGTPDDNVRHAISKISHLFMSSTKEGVKLLSEMGENLWRIHFSGLLGYASLENKQLTQIEINSLYEKYNLDSETSMVVVATMHPLPFDQRASKKDAQELFIGLTTFANSNTNIRVLLTYPNSDHGSTEIVKMIENIGEPKIKKLRALGSDYHKVLSLSNRLKVVLIGNSSSIIKEAPFFNCFHINIGPRQTNRVAASSQIDLASSRQEIINILNRIRDSGETQPPLDSNPYYKENSINEMISFIKQKLSLGRKKLLFKKRS